MGLNKAEQSEYHKSPIEIKVLLREVPPLSKYQKILTLFEVFLWILEARNLLGERDFGWFSVDTTRSILPKKVKTTFTKLSYQCLELMLQNLIRKLFVDSCHIVWWLQQTYNDVHLEVEHIHLKHRNLSSHCEAVQLMYEDVKLQVTRPWQGIPQGTQWRTSWNRKVFRFGGAIDLTSQIVRKNVWQKNGLTTNVFKDGPIETKRKGLLFACFPSISEVKLHNFGCLVWTAVLTD